MIKFLVDEMFGFLVIFFKVLFFFFKVDDDDNVVICDVGYFKYMDGV